MEQQRSFPNFDQVKNIQQQRKNLLLQQDKKKLQFVAAKSRLFIPALVYVTQTDKFTYPKIQ